MCVKKNFFVKLNLSVKKYITSKNNHFFKNNSMATTKFNIRKLGKWREKKKYVIKYIYIYIY